MASSAWEEHPRDRNFEVLKVPRNTQPDSARECLVYCLNMTIDYLAESYPSKEVNRNITRLTPWEIKQSITITPSGWKVRPSELKALSGDVGPVTFKHELTKNLPNEGTLWQIIQNYLGQDLPIISIINARKLREGTSGGVHAVVVTGLKDDNIAINDPWGHLYDIVDWDRFIKAWNDTINQYVSVEVGTQKTMENHSAPGGNSA